MSEGRVKKVAFVDEAIWRAFLGLKSGRFEDRQLAESISRTISRLREDPFVGIPVQRKLWPKEYVQKFGIDNLRKVDLPDGWRLTYFLRGSDVEIISIILEWFGHGGYEKRFGYAKK